jgi:DNA-binding transcriptional regulator YhcF (GntR family)
MMILTVDTSSGVPPYEQIRSQYARMMATGVLAVGDRLPTIAQLAADLGLANGTVARAYKELERDRLIVSHRRKGTFVAAAPTTRSPSEIEADLTAAAERFALEVRQLGGDVAAALAAASAALARSQP